MRYFFHVVLLLISVFCGSNVYSESSSLIEETDVNALLENTVARNYAKPNKNPKFKDTWKPYLINTFDQINRPAPFAQTTVGFGLLRFSHVRGSLATSGRTDNFALRDGIKGSLAYSRTPLLEFDAGGEIFSWLWAAFSYQHQGNIDVQTTVQPIPEPTGVARLLDDYGQFSASLRLDSFALKLYFVSPIQMIWKGMSYGGYIGLAVGPCWQSWTSMRRNAVDSIFGIVGLSNSAVFKNQYCASCLFMTDIGFKVTTANRPSAFSFLGGIKFNLWGQARNLCAQSKNNDYSHVGLQKPIRIRTIYQFAPYIGLSFAF